MMNLEFPCKCQIHSHQYFSEAMCYGLGIDKETGVAFALLLRSNGDVDYLRLNSVYHIKFA